MQISGASSADQHRAGLMKVNKKRRIVVSNVIIVTSMNETPEEAVAKRMAPFLQKGYVVVSAQTSLATHGNMSRNEQGGLFFSTALHIYYVTTVVLEIN
jgi:hypothetical protein